MAALDDIILTENPNQDKPDRESNEKSRVYLLHKGLEHTDVLVTPFYSSLNGCAEYAHYLRFAPGKVNHLALNDPKINLVDQNKNRLKYLEIENNDFLTIAPYKFFKDIPCRIMPPSFLEGIEYYSNLKEKIFVKRIQRFIEGQDPFNFEDSAKMQLQVGCYFKELGEQISLISENQDNPSIPASRFQLPMKYFFRQDMRTLLSLRKSIRMEFRRNFAFNVSLPAIHMVNNSKENKDFSMGDLLFGKKKNRERLRNLKDVYPEYYQKIIENDITLNRAGANLFTGYLFCASSVSMIQEKWHVAIPLLTYLLLDFSVSSINRKIDGTSTGLAGSIRNLLKR